MPSLASWYSYPIASTHRHPHTTVWKGPPGRISALRTFLTMVSMSAYWISLCRFVLGCVLRCRDRALSGVVVGSAMYASHHSMTAFWWAKTSRQHAHLHSSMASWASWEVLWAEASLAIPIPRRSTCRFVQTTPFSSTPFSPGDQDGPTDCSSTTSW
ncbi:hypothetical protein L210DRAFT_3541422 [Boletus edulis BED1]|uniref:Uncharacterized protein n=1 Tax=Boletus edulis BED1 TaxID=1328754 RepID=A0AAD4BV69_BOLED|nr:hypothetical protein L210DRAFT_3541422 [Boletus edulis BED1]